MKNIDRSSNTYSYYVFALLFLLYMFDYIDRLVIVSLFPYIKADWGLTDAECGMFVSAVYWSILLFSFPASVLVDRWSRKKSICLMSLLWSLAAISCVFTRNFKQLFAARAAIGIGEAGYAPGGTAMISAMFPQEKRARMLGFWNASIPLGSALGIVLGAQIAERFGWKSAFGIVALPGLVVAVLFLFVRDYQTVPLLKKREDGQGQSLEKLAILDIAGDFLRNKTLILNNLAFAANVFVTAALMTWLPTFFHRVYHTSMTDAGTKGGSVMVLAILGAPLGGYLADKWQVKRKNARCLFPAVSSFATAVVLFAAFTSFHGNAQYIVLLFCGIAAVGFVPASIAVTQDVVHPGLRAVSLSLCVILQHLFGSSTSPIFIGALSDKYGIETAMKFLPIFAVLAGVLYLVCSTFYERDLEKVSILYPNVA